MATVELESLIARRGERTTLHGVDLVVADGERVALLGPSGSGKTSLLRAIAGIDELTAGRIRIGGRDVTRLPSRERDLAMVDQSASLQPHLNVRSNIGFPLMMRHVPRQEIDARVTAEARSFGLRGLLGRRPTTLSTGERHEVALARSLVRRATVLLLDEPFAHHDGSRRTAMIRELIQLQEGYGVTLLCATNDQQVAMSLAHRCAVIDGGHIVQVGSPQELFSEPASTFVAGFVGTPPMNLLPTRVEQAASGARIVAGPLRIRSFAPAVRDLVGVACTAGLRPTDLRRAVPGDAVVIEEAVRSAVLLGADVEVRLGRPPDELVAVVPRPVPRSGELLRLAVSPRDVHLFAGDGTVVSHGV